MSQEKADSTAPNGGDPAASLARRRKLELVVLLSAVVALCSVASHVAIHLLGVRTGAVGYHHYGADGAKADTVLYGSSLAYDGLDWQRICKDRGVVIESWATPGSSPAEWEVHQSRARGVGRSVVVVSAYDLNEYWLCDFRAEIVPLGRTVKDLWHCDVNWAFRKRILAQYAMAYVRKLFPTVGRSDGVMTGVRENLRRLLGQSSKGGESDITKFGFNDNTTSTERVTDWSEGHRQRRLSLMRISCEGKHSFNGPKKLALERLLRESARRGAVTLVVMPVSPIYREAFLDPRTLQAFEQELKDMGQLCPQAELLRLDEVPALKDNRMFRDFVHLNGYGDRIATESFLAALDQTRSRQ